MSTIDMDLDRIAAALSGNYAGRPDLPALRDELARIMEKAETGEQHGRVAALEQMIENLEQRKTERRALARRLTDQAESAVVLVALEEIERQLTARLEARRRVTLHDLEKMIHTARSALSVHRVGKVRS